MFKNVLDQGGKKQHSALLVNLKKACWSWARMNMTPSFTK